MYFLQKKLTLHCFANPPLFSSPKLNFQTMKTIITICCLLFTMASHAQTLWSNAGMATDWYTNTNWTPNKGSAEWLSTDIAQFANAGTAELAQIDISTASLLIGAIEVTSARTRALTIENSSSTAGTLSLFGIIVNSVGNTILRNASNADLTIQNGSGNLDIFLGNTANNNIIIDGTGGITIPSVITGPGKTLTKSGSGLGSLTLTAANTYTGATHLTAGTLKLNHTGGSTLPATNEMIISGGTLQISSNQSFSSLIISGGDVIVDDGVTLTISGTLTLTTGKIILGTGNVIATTIAGGSSTSYVVTNGSGKLAIPNVGTATFPIGLTAYNPLTIDNGGNVDYAVKLSNTAPSGSGIAQPTKVINRQWDISSSATASNVGLSFTYNMNEGASAFIEGAAMDGIHFNNTSSKWENIGTATPSGMNPYTVAFTYTASNWSPFSFGNAGVLPIEWAAISVNQKNNQNVLNWQTANDKNTVHFDIQRATSPLTLWQTIGSVTVNALKNYQFIDNGPLPISYYRLRSVGFDGKETLSKVVSVVKSKSDKLKVYPTIATDKITIRSDSNEPLTFNIYNLLGQNVQTGQLIEQKDLNINGLSKGTYVLKVKDETVRFVKN